MVLSVVLVTLAIGLFFLGTDLVPHYQHRTPVGGYGLHLRGGLSALHASGPYQYRDLVQGLVVHMVIVGLPISFSVRWFARATEPVH